MQVLQREALNALLDGSKVGHVGITTDDHPVVIPTAIARDEDTLLVHGSTGSGWMRLAARGAPICVAVTSLDGIVVARSTFESTFHYRSAVIFGCFERLDGQRKERALDVIVEKLIPGRLIEVRPPSRGELNKTMVLSLPIEKWSLKVSNGWPDDDASDVAGPAWAGVVPIAQMTRAPRPAPDLRAGIRVPPSVAALSEP
jgi:uncharacterized protein